MSGDATVRIGGKTAIVWVPFLIDSERGRSTGTDCWHLLKLDGQWKALSLSFTNRPF